MIIKEKEESGETEVNFMHIHELLDCAYQLQRLELPVNREKRKTSRISVKELREERAVKKG